METPHFFRSSFDSSPPKQNTQQPSNLPIFMFGPQLPEKLSAESRVATGPVWL